MKSILTIDMLLPIGALFVQTLILLGICIYSLKKIEVIKLPLTGLEYSNAILASVIIFSVIIISTSNTMAVFQSFKVHYDRATNFSNAFSEKTGELFLIVMAFELILSLIILLLLKARVNKQQNLKEILDGSLPNSLITGGVILGFAIGFRLMAIEVMELITPQYLNFR